MKIHKLIFIFALLAALVLSAFDLPPAPPHQAEDPNPPDDVVKLVFIHHSTGENWLTDGYGNLGRTLGENNYFVSDTNYGWGPDAIGDRTDIPNWTEWFASENTPAYMDALLNESGQHASYTRALFDPGGENEIIIFKSCFPNSALEGSPDDLPGTYEEMTVSGAKYVYNAILPYFASRPDKLFVIITAPPLSDGTYAANARAFNDWLLNDWLGESNYAQNNVAVFDFYNILTSADAHHRFNGGQVEHFAAAQNTLAYPSGDDHPSEAGSQKATAEFVPLLNIFYHRWKDSAPRQNPPASLPPVAVESTPEPLAPASQTSSTLLDDFESDALTWEAFHDDAAPGSMVCSPQAGITHSGARALSFQYEIAPNSWGTCAYFPESVQDWSAGKGLAFYVYIPQGEPAFHVDIYAGSSEARETYVYEATAPAESVFAYAPVAIFWSDFTRVAWEENAGTPFAKSNQITGMAFGIGTGDSARAGAFWVDDLAFATQESAPPVVESAPQAGDENPAPPQESPSGASPFCAGLLLPLFLLTLWMFKAARA